MDRLVAVNAQGLRIGDSHPNAILTDGEVEVIRQMHEAGMSYDALAAKFEVSKSAIAAICRYERRAQTVAGHKRVHVPA